MKQYLQYSKQKFEEQRTKPYRKNRERTQKEQVTEG